VTNGSEQALSLVMRHYIQPGDWVIVETPTYHGALGILESLGARVIGIPMTGLTFHGMWKRNTVRDKWSQINIVPVENNLYFLV